MPRTAGEQRQSTVHAENPTWAYWALSGHYCPPQFIDQQNISLLHTSQYALLFWLRVFHHPESDHLAHALSRPPLSNPTEATADLDEAVSEENFVFCTSAMKLSPAFANV